MKVTLNVSGQAGRNEIDDDFRSDTIVQAANRTNTEQIEYLIKSVVDRARGAYGLNVGIYSVSDMEKAQYALQQLELTGPAREERKMRDEHWQHRLGSRISMITQELEQLGYHMIVDSLGEGEEEQIQWHGFGKPYSVDMIQELENVSSRRNEALSAMYDMLAERGFGVNMQVPGDIDEPIVATWSDDRAPAHSQNGWTTSASPSELTRLREVEAKYERLAADVQARGWEFDFLNGCDGKPVVRWLTDHALPGKDTVDNLHHKIAHTMEQRDSLIKAVTDKGWEFEYETAHGKLYVDWHNNCVPPAKRAYEALEHGHVERARALDTRRAQLEACKATLQALGFKSELVYNEPTGCWECIVEGTLHVPPSDEYRDALDAVLRAVEAVVSAHSVDGPAPDMTAKQRRHLENHWAPLDYALRDLRVLHTKLQRVGSTS